MKTFKGFTLAEVLITIAIIGVVASLTIPSVITNYRAKELETRYNKAQSVISNAMTFAISQSGATDMLSSSIVQCYNQTGNNRISCLKEASSKIFRLATDSVQNASILNGIKSKTYVTYMPYDSFSFLQSAYAAPEPEDPCAGGTNPKCSNYTGGSEPEPPSNNDSPSISADKPWNNVSYSFVTNDDMLIGYELPKELDGKITGFYMIVDTNNKKLPNKIGSDLVRFLINKNGQSIDRTCEFTSSCGE